MSWRNCGPRAGIAYGITTAPTIPWKSSATGVVPAGTLQGPPLTRTFKRGRPGESYIIAGEPRTLVDAIELAARITKIPAPRFRPSPGFLRFLAAITRSETLRVGAGVTYLGSNARATRDLGLQHRSLEEGLRETLLAEMRTLGTRLAG